MTDQKFRNALAAIFWRYRDEFLRPRLAAIYARKTWVGQEAQPYYHPNWNDGAIATERAISQVNAFLEALTCQPNVPAGELARATLVAWVVDDAIDEGDLERVKETLAEG